MTRVRRRPVARDAGAWSYSANLAWTRVGRLPGERPNQFGVAAAALLTVRDGLRLTTEVGAAGNPDPDRGTWPAVARFGVIASMMLWLDVDAGYQMRLNHAAPDRVALAGASIRS